MDAPPEDLLTKTRLLVEECRSLRKQVADKRFRAEGIRLDLRAQVAMNRERRANLSV